MRKIILWNMPDEVMLVVEHETGVVYQNQVGGTACWQAEMQGALAPLDLSPEGMSQIQNYPYLSARAGISADAADAIDAVLASQVSTRFLKVDRSRIAESFEAWIYVRVDSKEAGISEGLTEVCGSIYGFGSGRGVLTWPNSD